MKPILFLYPYSYWRANPNCVSLVERCEKTQVPFELICPSQKDCVRNGKAIGEWVWFVRRVFLSAVKQSLRRPWKAKKIWTSVIHYLLLKEKLRKQAYSLVITCDASGLGLLTRLCPQPSFPVVYLSFHILFRSELKSVNDEALAKRESTGAPHVTLALSQDETRKTLVSIETGIPLQRISCSAVAPEPHWFQPPLPCSHPNGPKIVLYCGNLEKWNLEEVLEPLANNLAKNFLLRVHTHFKPAPELLKKLKTLEKKQLVDFSYAFLSETDLVTLIDSCYVGLAPYFPQSDSWMVNQTLFHIGKASTKIAYYCMRKKPVITTPLPSLVKALSEYQFGIGLNDWSQIKAALKKIELQYSLFSSEAHRYFQEQLDPSQNMDRFWKNIEELIPESTP